jgi:Predicted nucleotide-binding protein containing TIR-like domain
MMIKIFAGSAKEELELIHEIEVSLEQTKCEIIPWDKLGLFPPGEFTFQTLLSIASKVDAAIFIFGEDDRVWYRSDAIPQPRDNVLLEYGLFSGALGTKKTVICLNGAPKLASDIRGLTYIDLSAGTRRRGLFELKRWVENLGHAIRITSPRNEPAVSGDVPIEGTFATLPADSRLYLVNTPLHGNGFWPQTEQGVHVNVQARTWKGSSYINSDTRVLIVTSGPTAIPLFDYYAKVGRATSHWHPLDALLEVEGVIVHDEVLIRHNES